ncbi:hypothetical protein [Streptomyces sp. MJM8645]|uniref:hypothetical protein n=1 Tax=Streptomycetaceae TaxID=2062 RepID=UPI0007AF4D78|nr:hypothetical protein [Streptomyces sp. MJM8645]
MPLEQHPNPAEHDLLAVIEAWAGSGSLSAPNVVLAQGRFFSPAPWPRRAPRRGLTGRCHPNALRIAQLTGTGYVEGFAFLAAGETAMPHAWCSGPDGLVLDPTWPDHAATAYLGIPMAIAFVEVFQQRTLTKTAFVGVLDAKVQVARDALRIFTGGIPEHGLLDVGRPLPERALVGHPFGLVPRA